MKDISQIVTQIYVDTTIEALIGKNRLLWKQLTRLPGKACKVWKGLPDNVMIDLR